MGGASIVGRVLLGSVADRIGIRQTYFIGFILMSVAFFWLALFAEAWMLYLFAVVFGFAFGGCETPMSPLIAALFRLRSHGLIFGITGAGFTIGAALGLFMFGYIFDVTGSYQVAFLVGGAVGILSLILAVSLRPIKRPEVKN